MDCWKIKKRNVDHRGSSVTVVLEGEYKKSRVSGEV